ncbi:Pyridoxal-dependent decarboxylase domain-containing protein 1 [Nowakowskiella sp. JEL0078]|nr:Pyridoxal-dependent decarboxylase domain-containing protein 1 [Nowakowskiella sp. JEL0078]
MNSAVIFSQIADIVTRKLEVYGQTTVDWQDLSEEVLLSLILSQISAIVSNPVLVTQEQRTLIEFDIENTVLDFLRTCFGLQSVGYIHIHSIQCGNFNISESLILRCALNKKLSALNPSTIFSAVLYIANDENADLVEHRWRRFWQFAGPFFECPQPTIRRVLLKSQSELMDYSELKNMLQKDVDDGLHPFMIIGRAGTPTTGECEDFATLRVVSDDFGMWLHVEGDLLSYLLDFEQARITETVSFKEINAARLADTFFIDFGGWFGLSALVENPPIAIFKTGNPMQDDPILAYENSMSISFPKNIKNSSSNVFAMDARVHKNSVSFQKSEFNSQISNPRLQREINKVDIQLQPLPLSSTLSIWAFINSREVESIIKQLILATELTIAVVERLKSSKNIQIMIHVFDFKNLKPKIYLYLPENIRDGLKLDIITISGFYYIRYRPLFSDVNEIHGNLLISCITHVLQEGERLTSVLEFQDVLKESVAKHRVLQHWSWPSFNENEVLNDEETTKSSWFGIGAIRYTPAYLTGNPSLKSSSVDTYVNYLNARISEELSLEYGSRLFSKGDIQIKTRTDVDTVSMVSQQSTYMNPFDGTDPNGSIIFATAGAISRRISLALGRPLLVDTANESEQIHSSTNFVCLKIGVGKHPYDEARIEELIQIILNKGANLERDEKFMKHIEDLIKKGIQQAEQELRNESPNDSSILRLIPIVGSVLSWFAPETPRVSVARTFTFSSGNSSKI